MALGLLGAGCSGEVGDEGVPPEEMGTTSDSAREFRSIRAQAPAVAVVTDAQKWKKLTVGGDFSCGIGIDDSLWCWGYNSNGQLGDGTKTNSSKPVKVGGTVTSWKDLEAGWSHICAVDSTNSLYCWGQGGFGQLGNDTLADSTTPVAVTGMTGNVKILAAGGGNTCAIRSDNTLWCWGISTHGQLNSPTPYQQTPFQIDTNLWDDVAVGNGHFCGERNNKAYCSGHSFYGQLGIGATTAWDTTITQNLLEGNLSSLASFHYTTCAIRVNDVYCWGANNAGQVGDGTQNKAMSPVLVPIPSNKKAERVSSGNVHTCAILADASVYCWGSNGHGQLGATTPDSISTTPVEVQFASGDPRASSIHAGGLHTCSLLADQTVRCWGLNARGQLGNGTNVSTSVPTAVLARGS